MEQEIKLGVRVKDRITEYEGIVVAKIEYLNGCVQFGVKARIKDAAIKEAEYIDVGQLEYIDEGINEPEVEAPRRRLKIEALTKRTGGEMPDRPKHDKIVK